MEARAAAAGDLDSITAIYNHEVLHGTSTFDTRPRDESDQREWFAAHDPELHPVIVFIDGQGSVLGWASLSAWSSRSAYRRTVEASVFVDTRHRRKGIARKLLLELLARARRAQHRVVLGRIESGNEASRRLLTNLGFRSVGTMHGVGEKFGRLLDVEILECVLTA